MARIEESAKEIRYFRGGEEESQIKTRSHEIKITNLTFFASVKLPFPIGAEKDLERPSFCALICKRHGEKRSDEMND